MDPDRRVADYFVVAGVSDTNRRPLEDYSRDGSCSPPLASSSCKSLLDPVTDITVIDRSQGETIPPGWQCIETTQSGFPADLNHGSLRSHSLFICIKRGRDKPPLVDIGVLYEGKERVMSDSEVVERTLLGRSANVNNSGSRTFLTFRRARENAPCNQLVVTDICVILMNKGETPPHAFCLIHKNLNKGVVGSDVYICYKKSIDRPPLIRYQPVILSRFPISDFPTGYSLPESVALFCQPMGATIELWPERCQAPRPVFSTFVLTSETAVKVYGAAVSFYEKFPKDNLDELESSLIEEMSRSSPAPNGLRSSKSICILSRWPFFDTFERFLLFLHRLILSSSSSPLLLPIESFISHFMIEVPFPSSQRPKILVQLIISSDETVLISQPPEDLPLPLTGASFSQMLRNLGPDNCLNVLILALSEQKILLHSLRPDVLTGVAEAVTSIIFPFHWQCPYIPLCPLGLCDVLNAPLPFIVGVDSRYFDLFVPPSDVACVDLDTNSIYLSESKRSLNFKTLPKKPARVLRNTLDKLFDRLMRPNVNVSNGREAYNSSTKPGMRTSTSSEQNFTIDLVSNKKFENQIDLEIQEAFVKFMASIMKGFRSFLRPITKAPTVGATDPGSLFDLQGFLRSRDKTYQRFYHVLMKTQLFARFIEERSFVSDKNTALAFFDQCLDKIELAPDAELSPNLRLLDTDDTLKNDRTVFIPAPEQSPGSTETYSYTSFGPLNESLFHSHPEKCRLFSISQSEAMSTRKNSTMGSPIHMSRRTKQEVRAAQRIAMRHYESPITWSKCLVSYVYSLWFIQLPALIKVQLSSNTTNSNKVSKSSSKNNLSKLGMSMDCSSTEGCLRMALEVLSRLQELKLHPADETCYRILMLLCGEYSEPVLAVKVLFHMRQNQVIPNAITYGYYNKAVLESTWSSGENTATLLWSRLRNVLAGANQFKKMGKVRRERSRSDSQTDSSSNEMSKSTSVTQDLEAALKVTSSRIINNEMKKVRLRTGSIVTANQSSSSCLKDFNSSAGVLMTSNDLSDDVFVQPDIRTTCRRNLNKVLEAEANVSKAKRPEYLRSYSFGNDAKIIKNLKDGPLKALKQEMERNHQVVPEEDLESNQGEEEERVEQTNKARSPNSNEDSKSDLTTEDVKSNESFPSPLKQAFGELFSPDGKVGSSFKSGIKFASSKLGSSPARVRASFDSSTTSASTSKVPALFRKMTLREESDLKTRSLTRSATLPASVEGSIVSDIQNANSSELVPTESTPQVTPSSSPWTKALKSKNFDYVNSTIKSAATSMASRFSEIKSNLSSTGTTPGKVSNTSNNGGSSFLSQWANMVAEKLDSNFSLDEDQESISSFGTDRKNSFTASEDDLTEHIRQTMASNLPSTTVFDTLENHYSNPVPGIKREEINPVLEIQMTSCCRCYNCTSLLFDEEIMEGWFPDDSNLNTQCVHCSANFVPLLTIGLKVKGQEDSKDEQMKRNESESSFNCREFEKPFTVPYLSPLVLRKEVESVIDQEGDLCSLDCAFAKDHPIIYWNLNWFFERINLPSHLPGLALKTPSLESFNFSTKDHRHVKVTCLWDNEELHEEMYKPIYRIWLESNSRKHLLHALVTEERSISDHNMRQILSSIQVNDMSAAMKIVLNERIRSAKIRESFNQHSLYRELLFLSFAALGKQNIDLVAFDREYRRGYEAIYPIYGNVFKPWDKPPSFKAVFCRRFFKQLDIKETLELTSTCGNGDTMAHVQEQTSSSSQDLSKARNPSCASLNKLHVT